MSANLSNPWKPTSRTHKPAVLGQPLDDPAGWTRDDLAQSQAYLYRLSDAEAADIFNAVNRVEDQGLDIKDITKQDFVLPVFGPVLADLRAEIIGGRGFVFLRGLPAAGRSRYQQAAAFWGIGSHVGRAVSQNGKGHLLGHVKNLGEEITSATGRGYNSASALGFHSDSCDIFGLCVLQTSKSGGQHRMASSVTVYNEMLKRRPDLVRELAFRFYRSRRGELPPGETDPWTRQPVFSVTDGYFAARGASSTIARSQGMPGVPDLTPAQNEAIALYGALAAELAMDVDFELGDISLVQNYVTLHSRTRYEDWPEAERKRHLLRLWMSFDGARPLHADIIRDHDGGILEAGTILHAPLEAA
ncbi:MAG: TauD/TfdA family dioxygenase [Proteobacteria bacterium]|nr:TauD/TfdA family dioxygenase [Pseudomonadota bacterium]